MTQAELLRHVVDAFEALGIRYMIGGSQASVYYGEPRFTQDIDIIADVQAAHLPGLPSRSTCSSTRTANTIGYGSSGVGGMRLPGYHGL